MNRSHSSRLGLAALILLINLPTLTAQLRFSDVTAESGVTFIHTDGSSGRRYLVESVSAGLALFDYDGDGDTDLYFLNGAPLPGLLEGPTPGNALYRNDGDWHFVDVTASSGLGDRGFGLGVAVADYDNDGDADLYLNNDGPNVLYRNNGDGTFSDVTIEAGVANGDRVGAGACFLDVDADGHLDLFVANYIRFSPEMHVPHRMKGFPQYGSPMDYPPEPDTLYRNNGDGTFTDVSITSGIAAHPGTGMGALCFDYDEDGDTDIYVANDVMGNFLFRNDGRGGFEEVGLLAGVAYDYFGREQASMGAEAGDYDNDGHIDLLVTSYAQEPTTLYRNLGDGHFEDATIVSGAGAGSLNQVTWGGGLIDFDNDGDRDLFVASGHVQDNVESYDNRTSYRQRNALLLNDGKGKFSNISGRAGEGLKVLESSRGAAFEDLDSDGDIDVVILNSRSRPTLLRNETPNAGHWLAIVLQGTQANRDGVGARVEVVTGDQTWVDEVHSGRGYQSHYGTTLHFGMGRYDRVHQVKVRWPAGGWEVFRNFAVDQSVVLKEGTGESIF